MGQTITLTSKDGFKLDAYRADPGAKPKGALVVIQEIFGVNRHIRRVSDGFAAEGYVAIAPAIFDRGEKGVELAYDPKGIEAGRALIAKVGVEPIIQDVQAAIDYAKDFGKVGVVGYCFGGSLAFIAATRLAGVSAAVGYYGGTIAAQAQNRPKVPVILHFGETDQSIPMSDVEKIKAARPEVPVYLYPAGHGFNCDERASYDAASAKLALERTLKFFAETLA